MKKRLTYILALMLALSCSYLKDEVVSQTDEVRNRISEVNKQIEDLYKLRDEVNSNISAMKVILDALSNTDFVTAVDPIIDEGKTIGYRISFSKSGQIEVFSGKDGTSPAITLKQDSDGEWYWTINGEWLLAPDGNKVRANGKDGVIPILRITEANWEISYDNGSSWTILGRAQGYSIGYNFKTVSVNDEKVTFTTVDGESYSFPFYQKGGVSFEIDGGTAGAAAGKTLYIPYTISKVCKSPVLVASSDGYYTVRIDKTGDYSGCLVVKCPETYKDGYIFTTVVDGNGYSFINVLHFTEEKIDFSEGMRYSITEEGGSLEIPFLANFNYSVQVSDDASSWLSATASATRADMTPYTLTVTAQRNDSYTSRTGAVNLFSKMNPYEPFCSIIVTQASANFSIDKVECKVPFSGSNEIIGIFSTSPIMENVDCDWLETDIQALSSVRYEMTVKASVNTVNEPRTGIISILDATSGIHLGKVSFTQEASPYEPDDMVFSVRPTYGNDFSVCLPLSGKLDCKINWGDGTVESIIETDAKYVRHSYDISEPQDIDVRISGKVTALNSLSLPLYSVRDIKQWGNVGLENMTNAFYTNPHISSLPPDTRGAFSSVTSFDYAFRNCSNLKESDPNLFAYAEKAVSFYGCFAETDVTRLYGQMFKNCKSMEVCTNIFNSCKELVSLPDSLFAYCVNLKDASYAFWGCYNIVNAPGSLFAFCSEMQDVAEMFYQCTNLKTLGTSLFDRCRKIQDFSSCFFDDTKLSGESPYSIINGQKIHLYERQKYTDYFVNPVRFTNCFEKTMGLSDYTRIPSNWK